MKKILLIPYTIFLITFTIIGCNESKSQANKEMKNIFSSTTLQLTMSEHTNALKNKKCNKISKKGGHC